MLKSVTKWIGSPVPLQWISKDILISYTHFVVVSCWMTSVQIGLPSHNTFLLNGKQQLWYAKQIRLFVCIGISGESCLRFSSRTQNISLVLDQIQLIRPAFRIFHNKPLPKLRYKTYEYKTYCNGADTDSPLLNPPELQDHMIDPSRTRGSIT